MNKTFTVILPLLYIKVNHYAAKEKMLSAYEFTKFQKEPESLQAFAGDGLDRSGSLCRMIGRRDLKLLYYTRRSNYALLFS